MTPLKKARTKKVKIDAHSKEFMAWVREQWKDKRYVAEMMDDIDEKVTRFLFRKDILKPLMAKLLKGATEHGNPLQYSMKQIEREIENEKLDLIGWELLKRFHKLKK